MDLYLFRPEEHHRLYNCDNITVEDVPLEKRQNVAEGVILIVLTIIYYILYILCIPSIYRHCENACYKLLFFISIVDCSILWVLGFVHGYFAITGVVYCSYSRLIYFLGCYLWGTWIFETSGQLALVINRCVSMHFPDLEIFMFGGRRLYFWFGAAISWGTYWFFYAKAPLFTGLYFSWFFNPYVGYTDDTNNIYVEDMHLMWSGSFAVCLPLLYIIFSVLFLAKSCRMTRDKQVSKHQKMMLLQVFLVSLLNFVAVFNNIYIMYFVPNQFIIHFTQFCWFHIHGFPPVIYLIFNASIRKDARKMLTEIFHHYKRKSSQISMTPTASNSRSTRLSVNK